MQPWINHVDIFGNDGALEEAGAEQAWRLADETGMLLPRLDAVAGFPMSAYRMGRSMPVKNVFIALLVLVLLAVMAGVVAILLSREQATVAARAGYGPNEAGQMETARNQTDGPVIEAEWKSTAQNTTPRPEPAL